MKTKSSVYQLGNAWEKTVYKHMASWLNGKTKNGVGESKAGNQYEHLLTPADAQINFVTKEIFKATESRFSSHKAGDKNRALCNTAASQPYCFNLFFHLKQNPDLADKLFSSLFNKQVRVYHIEPEFTPNTLKALKGFEKKEDESLGDQIGYLGTDADVALFYTDENNKKGVILIEFKFIEPEFSVCSSYKNKPELKTICKTGEFYKRLVENSEVNEQKNFLCGYNKYWNWQLTATSTAIDNEKVKHSHSCPFRFGANQLWRNMLLAEQVAKARNCDEFSFWVFSPKNNDKYLWKKDKEDVEAQFRSVLTKKGNDHFNKVYLDDIINELEAIVEKQGDVEWLNKLKEKYVVDMEKV